MTTVRQELNNLILTLDGWIQECGDRALECESEYWEGRREEATQNRDALVKIQALHYRELRGDIDVTIE